MCSDQSHQGGWRLRQRSQTNKEAKKFDHLTYLETLNLKLEVMDSTAISLCMENKLPILVLNLWDEAALKRALVGENVGTIVTGSAEY